MKIKLIINGKEIGAEVNEKEIVKLARQIHREQDNYPDTNTTKRWRAEKDGIYYFVISHGEVEKAYDTYKYASGGHYEAGNYYKAKEEAEKARDKQLAIQRVKDYIIENFEPLTKKDNIYEIYYNPIDKEFNYEEINYLFYAHEIPNVRFLEAKQVIDNCSKDLEIIFNINQ